MREVSTRYGEIPQGTATETLCICSAVHLAVDWALAETIGTPAFRFWNVGSLLFAKL